MSQMRLQKREAKALLHFALTHGNRWRAELVRYINGVIEWPCERDERMDLQDCVGKLGGPHGVKAISLPEIYRAADVSLPFGMRARSAY